MKSWEACDSSQIATLAGKSWRVVEFQLGIILQYMMPGNSHQLGVSKQRIVRQNG